MTPLHLFIVAAVQGITEFLPVSSSGHLVLIPVLTGFEDHGLTIDVAAHVGSLLAVLVYFRKDVLTLLAGTFELLTGRTGTDGARLAARLVIATIPVIAVGAILFATGLVHLLRDPLVVGWATILFGLILYWADRKGATRRSLPDWSFRDALILGLWQAVALVPGVSRSGATMTGARFAGFNRRDSIRVAMLMSMPTIAAAGFLTGMSAYSSEGFSALGEASVAVVLSFLLALAALHLMIRFIDRFRFTPYVIYRILLGVAVLILV